LHIEIEIEIDIDIDIDIEIDIEICVIMVDSGNAPYRLPGGEGLRRRSSGSYVARYHLPLTVNKVYIYLADLPMYHFGV
jgi:hypothetical protein